VLLRGPDVLGDDDAASISRRAARDQAGFRLRGREWVTAHGALLVSQRGSAPPPPHLATPRRLSLFLPRLHRGHRLRPVPTAPLSYVSECCPIPHCTGLPTYAASLSRSPTKRATRTLCLAAAARDGTARAVARGRGDRTREAALSLPPLDGPPAKFSGAHASSCVQPAASGTIRLVDTNELLARHAAAASHFGGEGPQAATLHKTSLRAPKLEGVAPHAANLRGLSSPGGQPPQARPPLGQPSGGSRTCTDRLSLSV
jgi:hypothetical protein